MEVFSRIGTKSGKNKTYGLKWKSPKNVGTKSDFIPFFINESISPNSNIIITTYPCIYLYIQQFGTNNMKFDLQNWLSSAMVSLAKCNEELTI